MRNNKISHFFAATVTAIFIGLTPVSAGVIPNTVLIDGVTASSDSTEHPKDVRTPPLITATFDAAYNAHWLRFEYKGETWRMPLEMNGLNGSVQMPVIPVGLVQYWIEEGDFFDAISQTNALNSVPVTGAAGYAYKVTEEMPDIIKRPDFSIWPIQETERNGNIITGAWRGHQYRFMFKTLLLIGDSNGNLGDTVQSHVRTLDKITAGTLYFKAKYENAGGNDVGRLIVEWSDITNYSIANTHTEVKTVVVPQSKGEWTQYKIELDPEIWSTARYLRIRHLAGTENGTLSISIRDIVITDIPADVKTRKSGADYDPGYPSRYEPTTFRVTTENVSSISPASNISPKLIWRLNNGVWKTEPMRAATGVVQGEPGLYEVTLPVLPTGKFEYYYKTDFTGYAYSGNFDVLFDGEKVKNIDDFSIWLDKSPPQYSIYNPGRWTERRSPSYYPEIPNMQLYNYSVWPPKAIWDGTDTEIGAAFSYLGFDIRLFRSRHNKMSVEMKAFADSANGFGNYTNLTVNSSYPMMQVGDYLWQAIIYTTNAVSLKTSVTGTRRFENNATEYEQIPSVWGEIDQDETARNPPMSGFANLTTSLAEQPVIMQIDYKGFLMYRFNTQSGNYEIRRAAWQDFNNWQAPNDDFARTFGLFETDIFETDISALSPTQKTAANIVAFESAPVSSEMVDNSLISAYSFKADKAWIIEERKSVTTTNSIPLNRAVKLSAGPPSGGKGSLETTGYSSTRGRDTLSFNVRASTDDENIAYYQQGYTWNNYTVTGVATFNNRPGTSDKNVSPANPSISIYGYYYDFNNYIEGRVTQIGNYNASHNLNNRLRVEIWQKKNGIFQDNSGAFAPLVSSLPGADASFELTSNTSGPFTLEMKMVNSGAGTSVTLWVKSANGTQLVGGATGLVATINNFSGVSNCGTVGVGARDCGVTFKVTAAPGDNSTASGLTGNLNNTALGGPNYWYNGGYQINGTGTGFPRWSAVGSTTGSELTRQTPTIKYRVGVCLMGTDYNDIVAPVPAKAVWNYDLLRNPDTVNAPDGLWTVSSFAWEPVSIPIKYWGNAFIRIEPYGSDGYLVIDNVAVDDWQGTDNYDPPLDTVANDENATFKATYSIIKDTTGYGLLQFELNRSRANPAEDQYIVTPYLNGGIGDLRFNYTVTEGNMAFVVETLNASGGFHEVLFTTNVTAEIPPVENRCYVPALINMSGKMRLRIIGELSTNGVMYVNNMKTTNYPEEDGTSWSVMNALISTFENDPELRFDGTVDMEDRSAAINNIIDLYMPLEDADGEKTPYIQSPRIATGIGEISFWYRKYPGNENPGRVYFKVAKNENDMHNNIWHTLTIADLNTNSISYSQQEAALLGLSNVENEEWQYFTVEFFKEDYTILRIYSEAELGASDDEAGSARVMFDNIIVTEPVRSSIDIGYVHLIPPVPLSWDKVGFEVRLANPRMNPSDIKVYMVYKVGTESWGRSNWERTVPLSKAFTQDSNDKFLFTLSPDDGIPGYNKDTVVQYSIKVTYDGTFPSPVYYGADFVTPSYYEPIDLNAAYATEETYTPYYFVFSVGTNCVFINEFVPAFYRYGYNIYYNLKDQFVELIGAEDGDISGWKLEHYNLENTADIDAIFWTNVMKQGASFTYRTADVNEIKTNNWGFYVLANEGVAPGNSYFKFTDIYGVQHDIVDQVLFPPSVYNSDYSGFANALNRIFLNESLGAMVLKRSMGAYVHRIVWGPRTNVDVLELESRGYQVINNRTTSGSAAALDQLSHKPVNWNGNEWRVSEYEALSPGFFNPGQSIYMWYLPPQIDDPVITPDPLAEIKIEIKEFDFELQTLIFNVCVTNGNPLTYGQYEFYLETSKDLPPKNGIWERTLILSSGITLPDGENWQKDFYFQIVDTSLFEDSSHFFRIIAVPQVQY